MKEKNAFRPRPTTVQEPPPAPSGYPEQPPQHTPSKSMGSAAPVMDLSRMLEFVMGHQAQFNALPKNIKDGLKRIHKMTEDPFRYASQDEDIQEKEAFLGMGGPQGDLKSLLDHINRYVKSKNPSAAVLDSLSPVQQTIEKELGPAAQTEPSRGEQRAEQKREKSMQRYQEQQQSVQQEDSAVDWLKNMFEKSKQYKNIFMALPLKIRDELKRLSMDPDNLKYLASPRAVMASKRVVTLYLK